MQDTDATISTSLRDMSELVDESRIRSRRSFMEESFSIYVSVEGI